MVGSYSSRVRTCTHDAPSVPQPIEDILLAMCFSPIIKTRLSDISRTGAAKCVYICATKKQIHRVSIGWESSHTLNVFIGVIKRCKSDKLTGILSPIACYV